MLILCLFLFAPLLAAMGPKDNRTPLEEKCNLIEGLYFPNSYSEIRQTHHKFEVCLIKASNEEECNAAYNNLNKAYPGALNLSFSYMDVSTLHPSQKEKMVVPGEVLPMGCIAIETTLSVRHTDYLFPDYEKTQQAYHHSKYLTDLYQYLDHSHGQSYFLATEPVQDSNTHFFEHLGMLVSVKGYELLAERCPHLIPIYAQKVGDTYMSGTKLLNGAKIVEDGIIGYCSPNITYCGANLLLTHLETSEDGLALGVSASGNRHGSEPNPTMCYGFNRPTLYNDFPAKVINSMESGLHHPEMEQVSRSLTPLFEVEEHLAQNCAPLGNLINLEDGAALKKVCHSLTPVFYAFDEDINQHVYTIDNRDKYNDFEVIGYCARVRGDCYAYGALSVFREGKESQHHAIDASPINGRVLCYVV